MIETDITKVGKVNTDFIYVTHIKECDVILRGFEKERMTYIIARDTIAKEIRKSKDIIDHICNYKCDELTNNVSSLVLYRMDFNIRKINITEFPFNTSTIKSLVRNITEFNKKIAKLNVQIKYYEHCCVHYKIYKYVLDTFNQKIVQDILEGYSFNMGYGISNIRIRRKKRTKANVDWGASNKLRQKIEDEGKVPFNKDSAPDGEKWMVYHTSNYEYWWYWNKSKSNILHHTITAFVPTGQDGKENSKIVGTKTLLRRKLAANPYAYLNYEE